MTKRESFAIVMSMLLMVGLFTSCQASEKNKWTPPKFVKEWEIKEIKPGLPHHIISITANKNGVFVLVKAEEKNIHLQENGMNCQRKKKEKKSRI